MNIFSGITTALVTPFFDDKIDFLSLEKMLFRQLDAGINGVVIAGSTGEGIMLSDLEYSALLSFVLKFCNRKIKVFASCTSITTSHCVFLAKMAQDLGVDGLMCAPSPYVRASQAGIIEHFKSLHDGTAIPIILYSVPQRIGVDFSDESIVQIARMPRVLAFKDAGSDLQRVLRIAQLLPLDKLTFLCGNDADFLAFSANGGSGCISVSSNAVPRVMVSLYHLVRDQKYSQALYLHGIMMNLYKILGIENNPSALKYVLFLMGLCSQETRPPLVQLLEQNKIIIKDALEHIKQSMKLE
jgi:4-hydroxy-tetrahydrodipicolinate synthase